MIVCPFQVIYNPYEDFTTYKMNQILAEGGFAPEWIMLKRDILSEREKLREDLRQKSAEIFRRQNLSLRERQDWNQFLTSLKDTRVKKLNASIDRFNLMVPSLNSQLFHFNLDREAEKFSQTFKDSVPDADRQKTDQSKFRASGSGVVESSSEQRPDFLSNLINLFFKRM